MKNFFKIKIKQSGFMMVEVVVVVSIITVSVLAFMAVAQKSIYLARQSTHTAQAGFLLEEGAEAVRILRDNAWSNISGLTVGTNYYPTFSGNSWTLSTTPNTVGIFTRTVTVANVNRDNSTQDISSTGSDDPSTKLVVVTVSWLEGGTTVVKTLSFYVMDIFS
jgi:Tfp pilus assembly protein PilV